MQNKERAESIRKGKSNAVIMNVKVGSKKILIVIQCFGFKTEKIN